MSCTFWNTDKVDTSLPNPLVTIYFNVFFSDCTAGSFPAGSAQDDEGNVIGDDTGNEGTEATDGGTDATETAATTATTPATTIPLTTATTQTTTITIPLTTATTPATPPSTGGGIIYPYDIKEPDVT